MSLSDLVDCRKYCKELEDKIQAMETKLREAELERDCLIAQRHMTIARLGGEVEGHPTHEINFLQRIDKLRELETRAQQAEQQKCPDLTVHHWSDFNKTKE